jgi:hypothetical protein
VEELGGYVPYDEDQATAYHEAGHAIIAWALGLQVGDCELCEYKSPFNDAGEYVGGRDAAGRVWISPNVSNDEADFLVCLAGVVAEQKFLADLRGHEEDKWVSTVQRSFKRRIDENSYYEKEGIEDDYSMAVRAAMKAFGSRPNINAAIKSYALPLLHFFVNFHWYLISALAEHLYEVRKIGAVELDLFIREHRIRELRQLDFGAFFAMPE